MSRFGRDYQYGLGVLYWYPKNAHFNGFQYHWRRDVKYLSPAEEAFDKVDEVRRRDLNIGPYGTNQRSSARSKSKHCSKQAFSVFRGIY